MTAETFGWLCVAGCVLFTVLTLAALCWLAWREDYE